MKQWAKKFYHSDKWQRCRKAYIQQRMLIDGGLCEECKQEQGYIVHHKTYLTEKNINDPMISLNPDNLKYVCKECHDRYDGHGVGSKLRVVFDSNGQPIKRR